MVVLYRFWWIPANLCCLVDLFLFQTPHGGLRLRFETSAEGEPDRYLKPHAPCPSRAKYRLLHSPKKGKEVKNNTKTKWFW